MIKTRFSLAIAFTLACIGNIHAIGITINQPSTGTLEVEFGVSRNVTLVSGQTGHIDATIRNIGTLPITFKEYDSSNPIGGFGWDFNDPGFAIGFGGMSYTTPPGTDGSQVGFQEGLVNLPQVEGPDFSHLSNVTIAPGQELRFVLYSLNTSLGIGATLPFTTYNELDFGEPIFGGWTSNKYTFTATVGEAFSISDPEKVDLTPFFFTPADDQNGHGNHVPDAGSTALLLGMAFGALGFIRHRI